MSVAAPPATETQYRPLSSLAIIGLLLGAASVLVFIIQQPWVIWAVALPGLVVSVLARRQVLANPDTLAGYLPATFGIVLSVASSVGYVTHVMTVDWIIEREAREFLEAWIRKVAAGEECSAFLDTVEPDRRAISFEPEPLALKVHFPPPDNTQYPLFDLYRNSKFVSVGLRYGDRVKLQSLGRPEIKHGYVGGDKEYYLKFDYAIETPIGSGKVKFVVVSGMVPGVSGSRRDWSVRNYDTDFDRNQSPYGVSLADAVLSAEAATDLFCIMIVTGSKQRLMQQCAASVSPFEVQRLYKAMRGNTPDGVEVQFKVRKPMLLVRETQIGPRGWQMLFQGQFDNETRELDFEVELRTPDQSLEAKGWQFVALRSLGERRKIEVAKPKPPREPHQPQPLPEEFRTR